MAVQAVEGELGKGGIGKERAGKGGREKKNLSVIEEIADIFSKGGDGRK